MSDPVRIWWTPAEIAEAGLPGLPGTPQGVRQVIRREGWQRDGEHARRRKGAGGGWEYHWKLFPLEAQAALTAGMAGGAQAPTREEVWARFEGLSGSAQEKARGRLVAIDRVEALEAAGVRRSVAVGEVARDIGVSARTLWGWLRLVEGVDRTDRLAWLAPGRGGGSPARAECDPEFRDMLWSDYLRPERPSFAACYRRALAAARQNGWRTLPERTMRRRLDQEVSRPMQVLARKGREALKAMYPPQRRDRTAMRALEAVNADFHKFDVFVRWPVAPGSDEVEIVRAQMVAFQDIYSGAILSWRLDRTANRAAVALAFGEMIERYGIPEHVLLDNGKEFANKFLTGQVQHRFKFKAREDDIPGLMQALGIEVHFATPYAGQSKPIERAFRDLCDDIARDPRLAGAWTGNRPDAKPENHGARAVDLDAFLEVVADGIREHNTRTGRRSETARGRSLIETFEASFVQGPVRRATEAQRRLWLMGAEGVNVNRRTGVIRLMGNEYWAPWLHDLAGQKIVARFDPADLWAGVHVYSMANAYLGHAPCRAKAGFFDTEEARAHNRARKAWMTAERRALEAARRMKVTEIGKHVASSRQTDGPREDVKPVVVRPVFGDQARALPEPIAAAAPDGDSARAALVADFAAGKEDRSRLADEEPRDRFRRALELERRLADGTVLGREEAAWLDGYRQGPEYRAQRALFEDFGESMFG